LLFVHIFGLVCLVKGNIIDSIRERNLNSYEDIFYKYYKQQIQIFMLNKLVKTLQTRTEDKDQY